MTRRNRTAEFWQSQEAKIRALSKTMTDKEIGEIYGVHAVTMFGVRRQLGIPAGRCPGGGRKRQTPQPTAPSAPQPSPQEPEIYIDELGRTITRYPAGYARGAFPQSNIVLPRTGRS